MFPKNLTTLLMLSTDELIHICVSFNKYHIEEEKTNEAGCSI
jgi:hypothetical protein